MSGRVNSAQALAETGCETTDPFSWHMVYMLQTGLDPSSAPMSQSVKVIPFKSAMWQQQCVPDVGEVGEVAHQGPDAAA